MIKGYPTAAVAAKRLKISAKTLNNWVARWATEGLIEEPPTFDYGLRVIRYFPPEYMAKLAQLRRRNSGKKSA